MTKASQHTVRYEAVNAMLLNTQSRANPDGDSYCHVYTNTYATNDQRHYQDIQLEQSDDHFPEQCCGRPSSYGIGHDLAAGY
jgi:hypothetical protein